MMRPAKALPVRQMSMSSPVDVVAQRPVSLRMLAPLAPGRRDAEKIGPRAPSGRATDLKDENIAFVPGALEPSRAITVGAPVAVVNPMTSSFAMVAPESFPIHAAASSAFITGSRKVNHFAVSMATSSRRTAMRLIGALPMLCWVRTMAGPLARDEMNAALPYVLPEGTPTLPASIPALRAWSDSARETLNKAKVPVK